MFKLNLLFEDIFSIATVIPSTLFLAFVILITGILIGGLLAVFRLLKIPLLDKLILGYISFVRGIPLIIHLYIAYYILPNAFNAIFNEGTEASGITISPVLTIIVAFSLYTSAGQSENIRAALLSVETGQIEAGFRR